MSMSVSMSAVKATIAPSLELIEPDIKPATKKSSDANKPTTYKLSDTITDVTDLTPLPAELAPLSSRTKFFFVLWTIKFIVYVQLKLFNLLYPIPENKPNFNRTYRCRPSLPVRVFLPKKATRPSESYEDTKGDANGKKRSLLPLYMNIHGGGYAMCDASIDDHFCRLWCERTGMIVVGLNYSKTPLHPFPIAVHDIAALAQAVIDDETLPIDKSRVIIGGFSAGGNLALSSSLMPELKGKIQGAVSYYPIVDWSHPPPVKWNNRLYTEKKTESLNRAASFLDWGYVTAGQDRKDKFLSPCYATREELPPNVCMVAAQHDLLCREARDMIYSLAGKKVPEDGWDKNFEEEHYKWMLIMGVKHGFTNDFGGKGARADRRRKICSDMYDDVYQWLVKAGLADEQPVKAKL